MKFKHMRKILFRAKSIETNKWIVGNYYRHYPKHIIVVDRRISGEADRIDHIEVHPETLGQFTGLTDKCGKDIYEGDICSANWTWVKCCQIVFCEKRSGLYFKPINSIGNKAGSDKYYRMNPLKVEIIGNIHDNPELIKYNRYESSI